VQTLLKERMMLSPDIFCDRCRRLDIHQRTEKREKRGMM
jgi:hypothetical protein